MKEVLDHRNTLYTIDSKGRRKWVYMHYLRGRYLTFRTLVGWFLVIFYLSLPWITIRGKQGVLLDIPNRRFIFFGLEFLATDTIYLFLILASLGMALFFFTSVLGRVWCGWACPETVFLEFVFRPIERFIEGSDAARRRLDKAPWTLEKVIRKSLKHLICAGVAWIIASTTLAYFIGREPLFQMMGQSPLENLYPFLMTIIVMLLMAFQFGWFREQFCTLVCPYARFQSVLMDQNSLLVGYDHLRGEPRGKVRKKDSNTGDCVDCGLCVRVCPTGIDIRNGTQMECIACANCIDACDSVMEKVHRPRGLIRYATESELSGNSTHWIRPRVIVYLGLLLVSCSAFVYLLSTRQLFDVELVRVSKAGSFETGETSLVTNQFSLKLANKSEDIQRFQIRVVKPKGVEVISPLAQLDLKPQEKAEVPVFMRAPFDGFHFGTEQIELEILAAGGGIEKRSVTLIGPER